MGNVVYNELYLHIYIVDLGVIIHELKDAEDRSYRTCQLEVDFICNLGLEKIYVQFANALLEEKM